MIKTSSSDEVFSPYYAFSLVEPIQSPLEKFIFINLALLTPSQTVDHPDLRSVDLLPELL